MYNNRLVTIRSYFCRSIIFLAVLTFVPAFAFTAAGSEATNTSVHTIRVVMDDNYPPFIFKGNNGLLKGILVDQWRKWEEKTGIRVQLNAMDWDDAQRRMLAGEFDVIDTIFRNEKREQIYDFSEPYVRIDVPVFFRSDISGIHDENDLKGFAVGVKAGDSAIEVLKANGVTHQIEFKNYEAIVEAARDGKVNVFTADKPPALYFLFKMGIQNQFNITKPLYSGAFHRAVLKGQQEILKKVESGFAQISKAEYDEIEQKWYGAPILNQKWMRYILVGILSTVLVLALLFLWLWILRRTVAQKTTALQQEIQLRINQENLLRDSNDRFQSIYNASNEAIFILEVPSGKIVDVNQTMCDMYGYSHPEAIRLSVADISAGSAPDNRSEAAGLIRKAMAGLPQQFEWHSKRKNGQRFWGEMKMKSATIGNDDRVIVTVRDITDRKQAEEALRDSEEKYRTLSNNILDVIYSLDNMGNVIAVNKAAGTRYGYEDEMIVGKPFLDLIHPDDQEKVINSFFQAMKDHREYTRGLQFRMQSKDGTVRWMELNSHMRFDENGLYLQEEGVLRDITERRQFEDEKRSLEERLQRAEKMESLGVLAGGVAHDLNNVLGVVVGYVELLLLQENESSTIRPKLLAIMKGGQRAATIVQDLLTLARRGVPGRDVLNLNRIISDCQESPEFAQLASFHSSVRIKTELEPDLLNISGSSVHLGKTLFNLVSNAAEAMPKGGILTVKTANQYLDKPIHGYDEIRKGDYVVLSVSDTGEGINAVDLKHIFEPFYTKKVMGRSGTGLGLSVVWGTVKDHHGYINVHSEEGKGSTFILYFPVTRAELSAEHIAISLSKYMGKGESILIVDDVKEQRDLAGDMLTKLNYRVTCASSGEEAVTILKAHKVDLMVLDMIMEPGIDGLDTFRNVLEIRGEQKAIIVSGFSETDRVKAAQVLGAGAYVLKPYTLEKLGLAVREELDRAT